MDASLDFEHFFGRSGISPTIKGFQKVFLKKWKAAVIFPKILAYMIKIVKFLVCITFVPCDAFIICKIIEKTGRMYQKLHIKLQCSLAGPGFRF